MLYIIHVIIAFSLIGLILLQQGKGAEAGASLGGSGASQTLFGAQGSATFLSRLTALCAATFFVTSLGLGYFMNVQHHQKYKIDSPVTSSPLIEDDSPDVVP